MLKSILGHWQSTLFGFIQALAAYLYAGTQSSNLDPKAFWALLVAGTLAAFKGAVSADASQVPPVAK